MILALPDEFFKDWKWQAGDYALRVGYDTHPIVMIVRQLYTNGEVMHGVYNAILPYIDCHDIVVDIERLRPLPNQEQLQKMVNPDWVTAYDLFYKWTYLNPQRTKDPKEKWLQLVIEKKYGLNWDGDKWQ
jgi:hypothetical protein